MRGKLRLTGRSQMSSCRMLKKYALLRPTLAGAGSGAYFPGSVTKRIVQTLNDTLKGEPRKNAFR